MVYKNNQNKYNKLRQQFEKFVFEDFKFEDNTGEIMVAYHFKVDDKYAFKPLLTIPKRSFMNFDEDADYLRNFLFQIGMVEMISYWKAICPKEVIIKAGYIDESQIQFWKKLYYNGLGEFFYLNGINTDVESFMNITVESARKYQKAEILTQDDQVLVPIGGGKDSAVTLDLLREKMSVVPFIVNPRKASIDTIKIAGFDEEHVFEIHRTIDPNLLKLNDEGYLNGHTPFSALLAFMTVFAAALTKSKYIALSNESSANEPTVENGANHQYSKSYEFEADFRVYVKKYLTENVEYFSFLRPLNEFKIARLFSNMPRYHQVFRSCNAGSKTGEWCGKCSKCLFTFIMLSPFMDIKALKEIYGKNLFEDDSLIVYLEELIGIADNKPFECVGTIDEVNYALQQTLSRYALPLPALLEHYRNISTKISGQGNQIEKAFDHHHFLEPKFKEILISALNDQ